MRRFVLLDRDGVINAYRHMRFVNRWDDFEFIPGALEALRRLAEAGVGAVVVSNQAGVGKGLMTEEDLAEITRRMAAEVERAGGRLLDVRYCPHEPEAGCACRKPRPGMLLEAARIHGIDLGRTWFVGDNPVDVEAGRAAGCRTMIVLSGKTRSIEEIEAWEAKPDAVRRDLAEAVETILG